MPDCPSECPIEEPDYDTLDDDIKERCQADCDECWWHSDEAHELSTYNELFIFATEWLSLKEIGLEYERELLTAKDEQAIVYVSRQQAQARSRLTNKPSKGD